LFPTFRISLLWCVFFWRGSIPHLTFDRKSKQTKIPFIPFLGSIEKKSCAEMGVLFYVFRGLWFILISAHETLLPPKPRKPKPSSWSLCSSFPLSSSSTPHFPSLTRTTPTTLLAPRSNYKSSPSRSSSSSTPSSLSSASASPSPLRS